MATLSLPMGLELLGDPDRDYLQRLADQAAAITRGRRGGRSVWRIVSGDGSTFTLDANVRIGHVLKTSSYPDLRGSYSAELTKLTLDSPPMTIDHISDLPIATKSGLGRISVRVGDDGGISVNRPLREIYFNNQPWVTDEGPAFDTLERALEWLEPRASSVEVTVDGPRGREIFGVGQRSGKAFRVLPGWLRGE